MLDVFKTYSKKTIIVLLMIMNIFFYYTNNVPKIVIHKILKKFLVIGSAPYIKEWIPKYLDEFINNGYEIITFNNSWKAVPIDKINLWHMPADFLKAGTLLPTCQEKQRMSIYQHDAGVEAYQSLYLSNYWWSNNTGTMFLNVIYYHLLNNSPCEVVVIGCDMIYSKSGDTFYSSQKNNKARNDPLLLYGEQGLAKQLKHSKQQFEKYNCKIFNASTSVSRLPYQLFTKHLD